MTAAKNILSVTTPETLRLDKWLWFARFFKSRSQATDAVAGGLVHVGGERVKPSRDIRMGDSLQITHGDYRYDVIVQSLPTRRGPANEAQRAYKESEQSVAAREQKQAYAKLAPPTSFGRPDKHQRRALRGLRGREF